MVIAGRYAWIEHRAKSKPLQSRLFEAERSGSIYVRGTVISEPRRLTARKMEALDGAQFPLLAPWSIGLYLFLSWEPFWQLWPWSFFAGIALLIPVRRLFPWITLHAPTLAKFRCTALPRGIRALIAAQLAIQLGLLIPLSGHYFGHYSAAGLILNPIAIPLAGIFIPAALVTGIAGSLGWLWIAEISGIVASVGGDLFLRLASIDTTAFAHPSVKPPLHPVTFLYYAILLALLLRSPHNTSQQEASLSPSPETPTSHQPHNKERVIKLA